MSSYTQTALRAASDHARANGSSGWLRARIVEKLLGSDGASRLGGVAAQGAAATSRAVGAVADAVTAPGGKIMAEVNDRTSLFPNSALGSAAKTLGITTPVLLAGGVLGAAYGAQNERGPALIATDVPYHEKHTLDLLDNVYSQGVTPMTDPFSSFVQRRKQAEQEKTAARLPGTMANLGMGGLGSLVEDFLFDVIRDPTNPKKLIRQVKVKPALGLGAGAVGLMAADDFLDSDPTSPLSYKAKKTMFGLGDRIEAEDTFASNFVAQSGKNTANLLKDLVDHSLSSGIDAVKSVPQGHANLSQALDIINNDDVLQRATESERDMLGRAFNTMQKYAPSLAGDEFAVRNYLRESLLSSNGPDYGTIANLAKAQQTVSNPFKPSKK